MQIFMCKSKIQNAILTDLKLHYEGSITIDVDLMEKARIMEYERVQVLNLSNGSRAETYVIKGKRGSGEVCLNGACARLGYRGDGVIIISYCLLGEEEVDNYKPSIIVLQGKNKVKSLII